MTLTTLPRTGSRVLLALLALLLSSVGGLSAQSAAPLTHDAYALWKDIEGQTLSPDGAWLAYALDPGEGDGVVVLRHLPSSTDHRVARGADPVFTDDSRFVVLRISPAEAAVEDAQARREDDDSVQMPDDSLAVIDLASLASSGDVEGSLAHRAAHVDEFSVPDEGRAVLAYVLDLPDEEEEGDEADETGEEEEGADEDDDAAGRPLVLHDLADGASHRFEGVTEHAFSEDGEHLFYSVSDADGAAAGVYRVDTGSGSATPLATGAGRYVQLAVSDETGAVAFLSDRGAARTAEPGADEDEADLPLSVWSAGASDDAASVVVAHGASGIPSGWWIAAGGDVRYSEEGTRILFGTEPRPGPEVEAEEVDEDERVVVDVWNWKDPYLQPMQLLRAEEVEERTFLAIVDAEGGSVLQLETPELLDVTVADGGDGAVALGENDRPYRQLVSWDGRYNDVWLIDLETGEREKVLDKVGGASLSPEGRYVTWWDGAERAWYAMSTAERAPISLSAAIPHAVHDELDDHPDTPPPYGAAGWSDDGRFLVYDRYDVWAVDPEAAASPRNLTAGAGREAGRRLRYVQMDPEEELVPTDRGVLLSGFHLTTKEDGFWSARFDAAAAPSRLVSGPYVYGRPSRAEDSETLLLTRESFRDFPDLWVAEAGFEEMRRVSDANPQQADYRWGTSELVEWISTDGIPLQGILYKPDGFDPSRQYPMMVYFYERMSDRLHNHSAPAAGSSSINITFYVSRGYVLFVPDIPYEIGFPGESALDAVVPGVLSIVDLGFVDPERIGVQGHSWGGYQIAHMITRTNLFAAAEAGAPVVNMTSAYGGIRWGSGMSRMFQYEKTQSRIGGTLWNARQRYIENSPLFFAPKIETPLLMLHNDEDTAVPWYQGIEMFVSMRRLGKPVWMFNYNGEPHGLRKEQNRKDWAIRMQQFFDHYLKGAPAPVWLAEGVPAVDKGETLGLELVTEQAAVSAGPGGG